MGNLDYKELFKRRRPHYNPPDGTRFLTFRLAGSIPKAEVQYYRARLRYLQDQLRSLQSQNGAEVTSTQLLEWRNKIELLNREWFIKTEDILYRARSGPMWLSESAVAEKIAENLKRLDGDAYRLDAYSIMSNHCIRYSSPFFQPLNCGRCLIWKPNLMGSQIIGVYPKSCSL